MSSVTVVFHDDADLSWADLVEAAAFIAGAAEASVSKHRGVYLTHVTVETA